MSLQAAVLALLTTIASTAVANQFVAIDFPEATGTNAFDINSSGEVVGYYVATDGTTHGFLLDAEGFHSID